MLNDNNSKKMNINGVELIKFNNLIRFDKELVHCFTTRIGGVSTGDLYSLNLGIKKSDKKENISENYNRLAKALNIDVSQMVLSDQVHGTKVRIVDENDCGKGILKESDILGVDALATNCKNVALVTFYADCVPVYFWEPVNKVIAVAHSGWKSSLNQISKNVIEKLKENFMINPKDLIVTIGPSIGHCCFEVSEDVYREFVDKLRWSIDYADKKSNNKWHLNLQSIIKHTLLENGVEKENISTSHICTKCNKDTFFSHRGDHGKTGTLAAVLMLRGD